MAQQTIGRYQILSALGKGGMATVYRALDPRFKREVAIKVLPREFLHDSTFITRFEREAQTVAGLEHPAIVPVYDFGEHEGQPFLVMRYMNGGSLELRLMRGPLPINEVPGTTARICSALDRAHRVGIIHRDVKPANILYDGDGCAYLSDFGIVKLSESTAQLTGSGIIGTPAYLAPEMMEQGGTTHLIDVYAMAVTLFQMLAGEVPYKADTPMGILMAHVAKPVPSILSLRDDLSEEIQVVLDRGMAKRPEERYQSAGALADDLVRVLTGGAPAASFADSTQIPRPTEQAAPLVSMQPPEIDADLAGAMTIPATDYYPAQPPEPDEYLDAETLPGSIADDEPDTRVHAEGVTGPQPETPAATRRKLPVGLLVGLALLAVLIVVGALTLPRIFQGTTASVNLAYELKIRMSSDLTQVTLITNDIEYELGTPQYSEDWATGEVYRDNWLSLYQPEDYANQEYFVEMYVPMTVSGYDADGYITVKIERGQIGSTTFYIWRGECCDDEIAEYTSSGSNEEFHVTVAEFLGLEQ